MNVSKKLLHLMDERDRTQAQLVRETGMWQSSLSAVCAGARRLKLNEALALSRALDVPLEWLADDAQGLPVPMRRTEEARILELARLTGSFDEAAKRLMMAPAFDPMPGGRGYAPGSGKPTRGKGKNGRA